MVRTIWISLAASLMGLSCAAAAGIDEPALPSFALAAPPTAPSPWTGLYVGSELFAVGGGKNVRGGFGGGGYIGYDREFDNNWVLGVEGSAGYTPSFLKQSPFRGYNYAEAAVRVGYDLGRVMPFVTLGAGGLRPNGRTFDGYSGTANSITDLFNSDGDLRGYGTVGAGFAYKLTANTTVELAVQAYRGKAALVP